MADKTGIAIGLNAGGMDDAGLLVALGTVIHLHAVPAVFLEPGDILAPDIPAVAGDAIVFVGTGAFRFADVAVAGDAIHLGAMNVGGMGKEDTVGLAGVSVPGNFAILPDILLDKGRLRVAFAHGFLMALGTLG
ncbi:hypothetical protein DESC_120052 [Desulfosarcina cetonica]|nr:hypothetical protein DESC_120052 [Desulfosarcina cetonica]